jgi:hypothetical protein
MPRTATTLAAAALAMGVGVALPAGALADASGGTSASDPSARNGATSPVSPAGGGSLKAARAALLGRWQRVAGTLEGAGSGHALVVQRSDGQNGWVTVAQATTGKGGAFAARWRPNQIGHFTLRAVRAGDARASATTADALPTTATTVYSAAIATQYGRGSYGSRTACGTTLRPGTIGVAHRTLPCGTVVEFYYRGVTVKAPVIDRGPYANGATWDLTDAAARALRFNGLDYVGAIRVGRVTLTRG